ncbi:MAG: hypothetical protein U9N54_00015 [candidate division Zixibacteria bacterium]|nr:hypothetical protein [candidate division Zixibacteria bacterium]
MDWKTFISEIVKSIAWPIVLSLLILLFKKQLAIILDELSKYPYLRLKRGENEFEIGVKKVFEETRDIDLPPDVNNEKLAQYASLALQDPKKTIQNSWQDLENTAKESIGVDYTQSFELEDVLKGKLPDDKFRLFVEIKDLRNKSVYVPESGVSAGTAIDFSASALKLSNYLKERKKDKV